MFTAWKGTYNHTTPNAPNNYKSTKVFAEVLVLFVCLFVVVVVFFFHDVQLHSFAVFGT